MVFGWDGERENVWWDPGVFSLGELESFFPKMGRKLGTWVDQNAHVHSAHHIYASFFLLFFSLAHTQLFLLKKYITFLFALTQFFC